MNMCDDCGRDMKGLGVVCAACRSRGFWGKNRGEKCLPVLEFVEDPEEVEHGTPAMRADYRYHGSLLD